MFGIPIFVMIFYITCCLELANLSKNVTKVLLRDSRTFFIAEEYICLVTFFEELMSFPTGIILVRISTEVFRLMVGLMDMSLIDGLKFSDMVVFIFLLLVGCADFAQGRILTLKKAFLNEVLMNNHLVSQADFSRQYVLFKESENETQLTAWKLFVLNRSFILTIVAFFISYVVIMLQFKNC
ncbi:uncharacterized protein CDAR_299201 [Caerostris darwini]|uniref:Uncharacterized protein n=1 Tax=Caerostris darwini TaxID=1538125 RepID=A0AAV4PHN3_9ARAC|nr:uncharacterized protein CDAR_299201 [Caerostris darwini]